MTARRKLTVIVTALGALIALSISMLLMGQTVAAVTALIPSICLGVQQIVQTFGTPAAGSAPVPVGGVVADRGPAAMEHGGRADGEQAEDGGRVA
ncbi:hypothetical protein GCM10009730_33550 [Streptomyces albidochromogenes]|uniref:hypothetical protein n=1 Tax=Streptomyces albidochromogenes TaxID=329524 RepID=UPI00110FA613|nr:hypothetical protein [Streptomyces albidochromogenes]